MLAYRVIAGLSVVTVAFAPVVASAQDAIGHANVLGRGAVLIRDGRTIAVTPNMPVLAGDRIVTRAGGGARVMMASGCVQTVGALSTSVTDPSCGAGAAMRRQGKTLTAASAADDDNDRDRTGTYVVAGGALLAIGLGAAALASQDSKPKSP